MGHSKSGKIMVKDPRKLNELSQCAWDNHAFIKPDVDGHLQFIVDSDDFAKMMAAVNAINVKCDEDGKPVVVEHGQGPENTVELSKKEFPDLPPTGAPNPFKPVGSR